MIEIDRGRFIKACGEDFTIMDRTADAKVKAYPDLEQALSDADSGKAITLTVKGKHFSIFEDCEERLIEVIK